GNRQADNELAPPARPFAPCPDTAAVQLDQAFHQGESYAETNGRVRHRSGHLREHLENGFEPVFRHPDAAVPDRNHDLRVPQFRGEFDLPAPFGVLGGVVQQVVEDLRQAYRVRVEI